MKIITIYHSVYGSTRQYAEWIHAQVGGELAPVKEAARLDLTAFDVLVCGGYCHAGKISIRNLILKNWEGLQHKSIVLFSTSGTPPSETHLIQEIFEASFPPEVRAKLAYFPLHGRIDTARWNLSDRALSHIGSWFIKDPDVKRGMVTDEDGVREENIQPIVAHIRACIAQGDAL